MYEFPCPHCSAKLRLRDRSLRGRTVDCPDCNAPVLIEEIETGLQGVPAPIAAKQSESPQPSVPVNQRRLIRIVWGSCGMLLAVLLLWTMWPPANPPLPEAPLQEQPNAPPVVPQAAKPPKNHHPAPIADKPLPVQRLDNLFQRLSQYALQHGAWPAGQDDSGLSWLGILEQVNPSAPGYRVDRPWNDVANDPFVRRRLTSYQLPDVPQLVGDDGYPAGHLAGVTGIGRDASSLPANHPRAGIFSTSRSTRPEDVTDGLANTLLVVGVQKQVGSWASPGPATLRGFTQEPYINGPDGIGTGQADGMHVLMADGSVRFLSAGTDPVILRRLAAMADGLPLDPAVPGDPGTMPGPNGSIPRPAGPHDRPIVVEFAPEPPPFNVQQSMQQKLLRFEQTRPLALRKLLYQWAELAAIPVDVGHVPMATLDQEFEFHFEEITLRKLLDEIATAAQLSVEASDEFGIRLAPAAKPLPPRE